MNKETLNTLICAEYGDRFKQVVRDVTWRIDTMPSEIRSAKISKTLKVKICEWHNDAIKLLEERYDADQRLAGQRAYLAEQQLINYIKK